MNSASAATTDNWQHVQAMCREALGEPLWRFIEECRTADQPERAMMETPGVCQRESTRATEAKK